MTTEERKTYFYETVEEFENEEIDYDRFMEFLWGISDLTVEAVGVDVWKKWIKTRRNHVWLKQFKRNEGQMTLF